MKSHARALKGEAILVDRTASYFGNFREVFRLRSRIRGNGILTLTEDMLTFEQSATGTQIEIPLDEIRRLGLGRWRRGKDLVPVLRITYSGNLVFGVHVSDPQRWVETMEALASGQGIPTTVDPNPVPQIAFRHFRILIMFFLVLVLVISVALPIIFSWVHGTTVKEKSGLEPESTIPTGTFA